MDFRASNFSNRVRVLVFGFLVFNFFVGFGSHAQPLPEQEVRALQAISRELRNLNWNVHQNSCINGDGFSNRIIDGTDILREVNCTCTATDCRVTSIRLKGLNLIGAMPAAFANLTRLQRIDLTRNLISGSIPREFARIPLVDLSMLGNRLSGSIPPEIGDIVTLEHLVLENNLLGGNLPESLGRLSRLQRLLLSANNFTGPIPNSYGSLRNLTDFRIDGNNVSGKLPEFIGNWTKLERLDIQGTSMENPIPRGISELKNLTELRITDLKGPATSFPNLTQLTSLEELVLRNCLIEDRIPEYIGTFIRLKTLDLSFNELSGPIPDTFQNLAGVTRFLFLTNNSLSGQVPGWILSSERSIDLSYNNFTGSPVSSCQQSDVNLVSSYSSAMNETVSWCLRKDLPCPIGTRFHSLFINCGGQRMELDGNAYEEDVTLGGKSNFLSFSDRWAYSSTGVFLGNESADYRVTSSNASIPSIYQTARLAPLSLKYYGLCLRRGSYNVKLHFAEIMFTADQTFSSLGERIFDISIQGNLVRKNFNILKEVGVGESFTLEEPNILVNGSTLEIHLYWAGKGTTAIPRRGVYGPLISGISVTPNFDVDTGALSAGAIAGIVVSSFVFVVLVLAVLRWKGYLGGKDAEDSELKALDLKTGYFSLRQIKAATKNFDPTYKIGEGGFGPVYKGVLSDGTPIAVKQLSSKSRQGNREFVTEIGMISALQHPNLVKLYGCCIEGNQLLLVYEYLENNSLARALFGSDEQRLHLDWTTRTKICLGIAKGLAYLHEESVLKIVHRDIKATNVLLDKILSAKISDFGLARLDEEENTHISTRIAGTMYVDLYLPNVDLFTHCLDSDNYITVLPSSGYMAPEYAMRGYLTDKADVYSFGVVALEIVSGKSNTNYRPKEEFVYLLDWAYVLQEQGNVLELVDPSLESHYSKEEVMRMIHIALLCTNPSPTLRPTMSSVVSMLEGKIAVQAPIIKRSAVEQDARFKAFERLSQDSISMTSISTSSQGIPMQKSTLVDGLWIDSSTSTHKEETQDCSSTRNLL
ncbi:probable LRR receptor-like serine/threonine-protein kinase At1g53440 isoform X1 [Cucurbita maxima]|uniref:non-specific serine/threonine protein kinase n=1 Tax=Cucurbita maxima TaxID=3661 RepID=A0A6J1IW27_CUCMA|nr:probable LRR receptor-like serine/threonine-protein kinase At1g53440 isoform X1 [Cucurbita maxima]